MTVFMLSAVALSAAVLLFLLAPLLGVRQRGGHVSRQGLNITVYREQLADLDAELRAGVLNPAEHDRARRELEARLLEDLEQPASAEHTRGGRWAAAVVGIAVPVLAVGLYGLVGTPKALVAEQVASSGATHGVTRSDVEAMVAKLAARMRTQPGDVAGWVLLGRSYAALGRFDESVNAYANAVRLRPRDAALLVDYADVLAYAQGRRLIGKPEELVVRALKIDPDNLKALALAGSAAFERADYKSAAGYWQRMLALVPANSEDAKTIRANVDEARARAGEAPVSSALASRAVPAPAQAPLRGTVTLAPALAARAAPDDVVFIYARAANGPRMPLAVLRRHVRDLPVSFSLDDSMAMAPGLSLSRFARVVVGARISKSGSAAQRPGDLEGVSKPVAHDAAHVRVEIDSVAP